MEKAGFVGFALVIALFLVGFTNDLNRLANGGFRLR
jgi:regulator of sigma E protease